MRRNEVEDYGQKFAYDPQWKGPLSIERKQTDTGFLVFFILYVIVWIWVGIYVISTGEMNFDMLDPKYEENPESRRSTSEPRDGEVHFGTAFSRRAMLVAGAFTVVAMLMNYLSLILLSYHPKTLYYSTSIFSIFMLVLLTAIMIAFLPYVSKHEKHQAYLVLLVMSIVSTLMIMLMIFFLIRYRRKIEMACGIIQESVKAVMFFPSALFIPIFEMIFQLIPAVFFVLTNLYLSGHPMLKYQEHKPAQYYLLLGMNLFGVLWTTQFIFAYSKMVLSGTFATWYWSLNKDQIPPGVVCSFLRITTRFHLGTLAFGSLIIAIFEMIRNFVETQREESRRRGGDLGTMLLLLCVSCLLSCVQSFINFINSNAYIMCTIHGTAFIQSGKDAFHMIMRNVMNIFVVKNVTSTITCPLVLLMFAVTLGGTYAFCRHMTKAEIFSAMLVVGIMLIIVSSLVFQVLGVAIDTVFLCAVEDFERNDGSNARPNFMSPQLKQLLILNH